MRKYTIEDLFQESAYLVCDPYYSKFKPHLEECVRLSKNKRYMGKPVNHLGLQYALLQAIEQGDSLTSQGVKLFKANGNANQELQNKRNRYLALAYKDIADGIAW